MPRPTPLADAVQRRVAGQELLLVLALSLAQSGVYALLDLLRDLTAHRSLTSQVATLNGSDATNHWVDLAFQVTGIAFGLVPVLLVAFLLARTGETAADIGYAAASRGRQLARGTALAAVIGGAGLALYLGARAAGANLTVVPTTLPPVWWRIPVLIASAAQNAVIEEVVVLGYLLRRLDQRGWSDPAATAASALTRGSYHLYQGFGGFAGNAVMGLIFVRLRRRWDSAVPMVVAHTLIDTVAFVGYAELAGHVSWLPTG